MSSILITHPMMTVQKVCLMKLVTPWCRVIFLKSDASCFSEIVETKKSGMGVCSCHSRFFSFHYLTPFFNNFSISNVGEFDEDTRNYTWSIDSLEPGEARNFVVYLLVGDVTGTELSRDIEFKIEGSAEGLDNFESEVFDSV